MKIVRAILSLALAASALLGVEILANDRWLWSAAPSHAYGLIAFVAIDLALVLVMSLRASLATAGAGLIATAQLGAMLADTFAGQPTGVTAGAFTVYLLSDAAYIGLLAVQIGMMMVAFAVLAASLLHKFVRSSFFAHPRPR